MSKLVNEIKKLKLFQNPELKAGQLYEFLRAQPLEVREYLQAYINDIPLTKKIKKNGFSLDNLRDFGD